MSFSWRDPNKQLFILDRAWQQTEGSIQLKYICKSLSPLVLYEYSHLHQHGWPQRTTSLESPTWALMVTFSQLHGWSPHYASARLFISFPKTPCSWDRVSYSWKGGTRRGWVFMITDKGLKMFLSPLLWININKPNVQHTLISSIWSTFPLLSELMFPGKKISPTLRPVLRHLPSVFLSVIMLVTTEWHGLVSSPQFLTGKKTPQ